MNSKLPGFFFLGGGVGYLLLYISIFINKCVQTPLINLNGESPKHTPFIAFGKLLQKVCIANDMKIPG